MLVSVLYGPSYLEQMFKDMGRQEQFSQVGIVALFEHLYDLSEETGEDIQIDVIALCCDFSEFDDITDYNEQNGTDYASWDDAEANCIDVVQFDRHEFVQGPQRREWKTVKVGGIVHG